MTWGSVELEPEVRKWLEALPTALFARAAFYIDLLAEKGPLLGEIAAGRRIILLTVFRKTRWREQHEIDRARRAWAKCVAEEHTAQEEGQ